MKFNLKRRLDKLILNTFYILFITIVILFLAEVSARIFLIGNTTQLKKPDENSKAYSYFDWRGQYFKDKKMEGGEYAYEPYTEWRHKDKKSDLINIRNGYRVTWEPEKVSGKKDFVIFMFGGSTTYCIESPDELTIVSILAKKLNESSSRYRYVIRNYGVNAFVSDQEVNLLIKLLREGERPDAVIFYDGLNDTQIKVGLGRKHLYEVLYQDKLFGKMNWRARASKIANQSLLVSFFTDQPSLILSLFPFIRDRATLRQNAKSMLVEYEENVRLTKALGEAYGFRAMHFWQPSMFNTDKTLTTDETRNKALYNDLYDVNQLVHDIVAKVAEEQSFFERAEVIDISNALDNVSETIFVDSNHVTPIGNAALADAMFYWILSELKSINIDTQSLK